MHAPLGHKLQETVNILLIQALFKTKEPSKESTLEKKVKHIPTKTKDSEDASEDLDDNKTPTSRGPSIEYSVEEEELLIRKLYESAAVDYTKLFYSENTRINGKEAEYIAEHFVSHEIDSDSLSADQAEDTFKELQYAAVTGTSMGVNQDQKRKFDNWIKFNPALFKLFESCYGVTSDVNYSPIN